MTTESAVDSGGQLLAGLTLFVDPAMQAEEHKRISALVRTHGGSLLQNLPDSPPSDTIVVSESFCKTLAARLRIVTPLWVDKVVQHQKLCGPEYYSADPAKFFSGIVACCDEQRSGGTILEQDVRILFGGIAAFGGQWRDSLTSEVTHLIALSDTSPITRQAASNPGIKIIVPHYFEDCYVFRQRCPEDAYLFPNPHIMSENALDFLSGVPSQSQLPQQQISSQKELQRRGSKKKKILSGQFIYFYIPEDADATTSTELAKLAQDSKAEGAQIHDVYTPETTTIVVMEIRDAIVYKHAMGAGKMVGTPRWLRRVLDRGELDSPLNAVLHHPRPSGAIPGMERMVICVSNYVGEARKDIGLMAAHVGASFTNKFTVNNTHLVIAVPMGEKFVRAIDWKVHIVNHLWLEETYARWSLQAESAPMYVRFSLVLGSIVNRSCVWMCNGNDIRCPIGGCGCRGGKIKTSDVLNQNRQIEVSSSRPVGKSSAHSLLPTTSIVASVSKRNEARKSKADAVADVDNHPLVPAVDSTINTAADHMLENRPPGTPMAASAVTDFNDASVIFGDSEYQPAPVPRMVPPPIPVSNFTSRLAPLTTPILPVTPATSSKSKSATPLVPTQANNSQARASDKHESKKSTPAGGSTTSKKRPTADTPTTQRQPEARRQRLSSHGHDQPVQDLTDSSAKDKSSTADAITESPAALQGASIVFSTTIQRLKVSELRELKRMGATHSDSKDFTCLVATSVVRTEKFLLAILRGNPIVDMRWVDACRAAGKMIPPSRGLDTDPTDVATAAGAASADDFILVDTEKESRYEFVLRDSLRRVRSGHRVFDRRTVFVTACAAAVLRADIIDRLVRLGGGHTVFLASQRTFVDVSTGKDEEEATWVNLRSACCARGGEPEVESPVVVARHLLILNASGTEVPNATAVILTSDGFLNAILQQKLPVITTILE